MEQAFAHLSDPHLTSLDGVSPRSLPDKRLLGFLSWRRKRRFEHRREVLETLVTHLKARPLDQIVLTGDLTHIGLPREFQQAASWLRELGDPELVALVPGNHECYVAQPWQAGFAQWQDYLPQGQPEQLWPSLRTRGKLAFIGLSSACATAPFMASGTLGPEQLGALEGVLRETREQGLLRVVYLHHSPVPGVEQWRKRLTDAAQLAELLSREGAELVLHGHGHRFRHHALSSARGEIPVLAVPSASAMGLHGADTARYHYFQVRGYQGGWKVGIESWSYRHEAAAMEPAEPILMELPRDHAG